MPTRTRPPSLVIVKLLGWPLSATFFNIFCGLSIDYIHDGFRFVADVDPFPIGRKKVTPWGSSMPRIT